MNDEEFGTALLSPLRTEPPVVSFVDVPRAIREGSQKRKRRRLGTAAAAVVAVAATAFGGIALAPGSGHSKPPVPLPPDPPLPTSCTVTRLPLGGLTGVNLNGGDSTGRWQFGTVNANLQHTRTAGVIWHDGEIAVQVALPSSQWLTAINSSGVAVGGDSEGSFTHPFVVRNGVKTAMNGTADPTSINDNGVVVGVVDRNDSVKAYAVRWRSADAEPERLPDIDGYNANNVFVGDDGLIVGVSFGGGLLLWYPDGHTKRIIDPPYRVDLTPTAYRDGWIYFSAGRLGRPVTLPGVPTSQAAVTSIPVSAARYYPATGVWQGLGPVSSSVQLVPMQSDFSTVPEIWIGRTAFPLPSPSFSLKGLYIQILALSDDGHYIAGQVEKDVSFQSIPLRWTCK